jgi:hypothetical protein
MADRGTYPDRLPPRDVRSPAAEDLLDIGDEDES